MWYFLENLFAKLEAMSYRFWLFVCGEKENKVMEKNCLKSWQYGFVTLWWDLTKCQYSITYINVLGELTRIDYYRVEESGQWRVSGNGWVTDVDQLRDLVLVKSVYSEGGLDNALLAGIEKYMSLDDVRMFLVGALQAATGNNVLQKCYFPIWKRGFVGYYRVTT
jgi:hypothetical protein